MRVVVYTNENCQPCKATKRRLKAWGASWEEVPINDEISDQLRSEGFLQAPVVKVYDDELNILEEAWTGFNVTKLEKYFKPEHPGIVIGQSDGVIERTIPYRYIQDKLRGNNE